MEITHALYPEQEHLVNLLKKDYDGKVAMLNLLCAYRWQVSQFGLYQTKCSHFLQVAAFWFTLVSHI